MSPTDVITVLLADAVTWVEVALIVCFGMFLAVIVWVLIASRGRYDAAARIPLRDDRPVQPRRRGDDGKEALHVR